MDKGVLDKKINELNKKLETLNKQKTIIDIQKNKNELYSYKTLNDHILNDFKRVIWEEFYDNFKSLNFFPTNYDWNFSLMYYDYCIKDSIGYYKYNISFPENDMTFYVTHLIETPKHYFFNINDNYLYVLLKHKKLDTIKLVYK
jgi:hypothetical protein